jgi:hypothetical protein
MHTQHGRAAATSQTVIHRAGAPESIIAGHDRRADERAIRPWPQERVHSIAPWIHNREAADRGKLAMFGPQAPIRFFLEKLRAQEYLETARTVRAEPSSRNRS